MNISAFRDGDSSFYLLDDVSSPLIKGIPLLTFVPAMDPVGGAASIITLAVLSKDIVQTCQRYFKDVRDAPIVLSRFCNELETLTVLLDHFLLLHHKTKDTSTGRSSVLTEVLRRAHLLKDYESQLKKLEIKVKKADLRNVRRRLLFPLQEHQILDGLNVVQRIRSILESAVLLDNR